MRVSRRDFVGSLGALAGAAALRPVRLFGAADLRPVVRFGMVTDLHYALIDPDPAPIGVVGRRFYRESCRKLAEAVDAFNARKLDFAIELGDFKDNTNGREGTLRCLADIERTFAGFNGPRYHVAGNHDFDCLTAEEFFGALSNDGRPWSTGHYFFDRAGIRFVVLDACYDSSLRHYSRNNPWQDANVPPEEIAWLERTLAAAPGAVVVFCHQRLDPGAAEGHLVKNAAAVRRAIAASGKVKAVFTGHQHKGGVTTLDGITYYSLRALVCDSGEGSNSFVEVGVAADGAFTVYGWRNAVSHGVRGEYPARGLIAHRGDCDECPEDTLPAFHAAVRKGAEMVELDEWRCRTGELVVMHDPSVDRTTDGHGRLADLTLAEIKALDAGAKKGARFAGVRVPTLAEALACFPKTGLYLNIHCKTAEAAPEVARLLRGEGRLAQAILMCDGFAELRALKAECPWARAGVVLNDFWKGGWTEARAWEQLRAAVKEGADFVQLIPGCRCTAAQLAYLHAHGVRTTYFEANDAGLMTELVREGHDFVFTDHYSAMRGVFDAVR